MQMSSGGTRMQLDLSSVVTRVPTIAEANALQIGSVVGDTYGGVTFSDAVATILEKRSHTGWCDIPSGTNDQRWTVIIINR